MLCQLVSFVCRNKKKVNRDCFTSELGDTNLWLGHFVIWELERNASNQTKYIVIRLLCLYSSILTFIRPSICNFPCFLLFFFLCLFSFHSHFHSFRKNIEELAKNLSNSFSFFFQPYFSIYIFCLRTDTIGFYIYNKIF